MAYKIILAPTAIARLEDIVRYIAADDPATARTFAMHLLDRANSLSEFPLGKSQLNCGVSTMKEIQAALPKLSREEIEEIREWIDDYLEDQLELTDEVKAKLEQSRREIAPG